MKTITIQRDTPASYAYLTLALAGPAHTGGEPGRDLRGLIDTGASHVLVRSSLLEEAGIPVAPASVSTTQAISSAGDATSVYVDLVLPCVDASDRPACIKISMMVYAVDGLNEEMLIGLDLLQHFDVYIPRFGPVRLVRS